MQHILPLLSLALLIWFPTKGWAQHTLKEAFADNFLVGAAIDYGELRNTSAVLHKLIRNEFSALVCENSMKADHTEPREGVFNFAAGDAVVDYAQRNGQVVTGHCLVWHSQCPVWMFGSDSTGHPVDRELLIRRMRNHIYGVCGHYCGQVCGKVKGWDVVNEAIEGDGSWRQSEYYRILGDEFIPLAARINQALNKLLGCKACKRFFRHGLLRFLADASMKNSGIWRILVAYAVPKNIVLFRVFSRFSMSTAP